MNAERDRTVKGSAESAASPGRQLLAALRRVILLICTVIGVMVVGFGGGIFLTALGEWFCAILCVCATFATVIFRALEMPKTSMCCFAISMAGGIGFVLNMN